jgi:DNA-binding MarR family transcriptional regulator
MGKQRYAPTTTRPRGGQIGEHVGSAKDFDQLAYERIRLELAETDLTSFAAMVGLMRAAARLETDFESVVQRPRGLTWAGFRLLYCLWVMGPMQTSELARVLFTTAPTVSSVLNTLERRGLIRRERQEDDRRRVAVHLTLAGEEVFRATFTDQQAREAEWLEGIPAEDLTVVVRVLEALANRARPALGAGAEADDEEALGG